ncbi:MAG: DUF1974 domain-containing protein, partial [Comamonadaceae bacterium]
PVTLPYYARLTRYSTALAVFADVSMLVMGGDLKRRETLSARLGDILAQLYLASAALKRFEVDGRPAEDEPLVHWAVQDSLLRIRVAFEGVLENFPNRGVAALMRLACFPFGLSDRAPADKIGQRIARLLTEPGAARDRISNGCYLPTSTDEPVGAIEQALHATLAAEKVDAKVRSLEKSGKLAGHRYNNVRDLSRAAFDVGALSQQEYDILAHRDALRDIVIAVDDFPHDYAPEQAHTPGESA